MSQTVTIRVYHTANSIFTLYSHKVSILVLNVCVYNLEEWLLRGSLLPCYKKLKSRIFFKRLEAASIELKFYKIQCYLSRPRLNAFLYVFDHFSCKEENERQISLALYIRLEYNNLVSGAFLKCLYILLL